MTFALIIIGSILILGIIAALLSWGDKDEPVVNGGECGDDKERETCASCSSRGSCKLADLCKTILWLLTPSLLTSLLLLTSCATKQNTARSRFFHAFHARYNIYYNGSQAFIEGSEEQEKGHRDNFTEMIPLYMVANKQTRTIGGGKFDR